MRDWTGRIHPVEGPRPAGAPFAQGANAIFTRRISLDTKRSQELIREVGTAFWVVNASDSSATASLQLNDQRNAPFAIGQGFAFSGVRFDAIYLSNEAQAGAWIDVFVVREDAGNFSFVNPVQPIVSLSLQKPTTHVHTHGVTVVAGTVNPQLLLAADATRHYALIQNVTTGSSVRLRPDATIGSGFIVYPGEHIRLDGTAAVYANMWDAPETPKALSIIEVKD